MSETKSILSKEDELEVVAAIQTAEANTSGEIRVHIEKTTKLKHYDRALEVFEQLEMFKTAQRNGVLIYVASEDRKFVICGDEGIDKVVSDDFWDTTRDEIATHFKQGKFKEGLIGGILHAGQQLKQFFPWQKDDTNELSNELSKG